MLQTCVNLLKNILARLLQMPYKCRTILEGLALLLHLQQELGAPIPVAQ